MEITFIITDAQGKGIGAANNIVMRLKQEKQLAVPDKSENRLGGQPPRIVMTYNDIDIGAMMPQLFVKEGLIFRVTHDTEKAYS